MSAVALKPGRDAVFLTVEEVAARYRTSPKAIHDRTRKNTIPYLKRAGTRRLLFPVAELEAWDAGAELATFEMPDGSRCTQTVRNWAFSPLQEIHGVTR